MCASCYMYTYYMLHMIHRSSGKGDCLPKRLRKFTVYFRIDCCSLWIDPIIQNIKHIPKKSTAKSQFYNDWCPYCRVCLYDWSHVIQKDVQLILMPPWLDWRCTEKTPGAPNNQCLPQGLHSLGSRNGTVVEAPKVLWGFHRWKWLEYQNNAIAQKKTHPDIFIHFISLCV